MSDDRFWIFLIDTDSYAGNFMYDMCAYMTGRVGDNDDISDNEMVARYCEDMEIDPKEERNNHIVSMSVDGECQPAAMRITPGTEECNSVAIFMNRRPTESEVESMIVRARQYVDKVIPAEEEAKRLEFEERGWDFSPSTVGILGFRLLLRETTESQVASFPTS